MESHREDQHPLRAHKAFIDGRKIEQFPLDSTPITQSIQGLVELKIPFVNLQAFI